MSLITFFRNKVGKGLRLPVVDIVAVGVIVYYASKQTYTIYRTYQACKRDSSDLKVQNEKLLTELSGLRTRLVAQDERVLALRADITSSQADLTVADQAMVVQRRKATDLRWLLAVRSSAYEAEIIRLKRFSRAYRQCFKWLAEKAKARAAASPVKPRSVVRAESNKFEALVADQPIAGPSTPVKRPVTLGDVTPAFNSGWFQDPKDFKKISTDDTKIPVAILIEGHRKFALTLSTAKKIPFTHAYLAAEHAFWKRQGRIPVAWLAAPLDEPSANWVSLAAERAARVEVRKRTLPQVPAHVGDGKQHCSTACPTSTLEPVVDKALSTSQGAKPPLVVNIPKPQPAVLFKPGPAVPLRLADDSFTAEDYQKLLDEANAHAEALNLPVSFADKAAKSAEGKMSSRMNRQAREAALNSDGVGGSRSAL